MRHAVIFDLDDTLFPEIDYLRSSYRVIAAETARRGTLPEADALRLLYDNIGPRAFDSLFDAQRGNRLEVSEMVQIYRTHHPDIHLSETTRTVLQQLHDDPAVAALGIITDGRVVTQQAKFDALGLGAFVDPSHFLISEAVGSDKLLGVAFEMMEQLLDDMSLIFWYIGDNPRKDFFIPNRRGWVTVQVTPPAEAIHPLPESPLDAPFEPRFHIDSLSELPSLIERFKKIG